MQQVDSPRCALRSLIFIAKSVSVLNRMEGRAGIMLMLLGDLEVGRGDVHTTEEEKYFNKKQTAGEYSREVCRSKQIVGKLYL